MKLFPSSYPLALQIFLVLYLGHSASSIYSSEESTPALAGRVLLTELNCTSCHIDSKLPPKEPPILDQAGARIHPNFLEKFIADPHALKPDTTMPNVLSALPDAERKKTAKAIANYIKSLSKHSFAIEKIDLDRVNNGKKLYHKIGCVACHSPEGKSLPGASTLAGIDTKYSLTSLTSFLENPLDVRPSGRMPDMHLNHWEALDLANYLLRNQKLESPKVSAREDTQLGKVLFEKHGCAQCHQPTSVTANPAPPLAKLEQPDCSATHYALSETQKKHLAAALKEIEKPLDPEQQIHLTMTSLNCLACHQRSGKGGPSNERDSYFTTSNLNLGEQARIPPSLTGVGAKLDPRWLRKVLYSGASVRPYMNTRMPKFGIENVDHLVTTFAKTDKLPPPKFERIPDKKVAREAGQKLVGNKNLSCVACHTWKGETSTTLNGVDLTSMTERLQEGWFHHYLYNPQKFHPSTIMPSFWPSGKSVRPEILNGDPGQQIDAIWQYLSRGKEARTPSGVRREPIEYGPTNGEAVMLRRQYNGIGKRGIGVGYPSGINLSFDAGQLRLGSIWKGPFGEMSGVWRGQGSGNVGERSRDIVRFPIGPAFALLNTDKTDWPVLEKGKQLPGYQFLGYTLDEIQRPTFRYSYAGLTVNDQLIDHEGQLNRTLSFKPAAPKNLYFRAAADKELKPTDDPTTYQLPRGLKIQLSNTPVLRKGNELVVPLEGVSKLTINYTFSAE